MSDKNKQEEKIDATLTTEKEVVAVALTPEEKEQKEKKKKYAIIALILLLLLGIAIGVVLMVRPTFDVKESALEGIQVEYGEQISTDYNDYIDIEEEIALSDQFSMIIHAKNEKDKEYPAVGAYDVEFHIAYGVFSQSATVQVIVADTTKPKIKGAKDLVVTYGSGADFLDGITVTDLSDFELQVDASGVDLLTPGEYTLVYTAIDVYGNKRVKEVTVTVVQSGYTGGSGLNSNGFGRFITYIWSEELQQWIELEVSEEFLSQIPENVVFTSMGDVVAEMELLTLINNGRLKQGIPALVYDADLYQIAKERAITLGSILSQTDAETATYPTTVEGADGEIVGYESEKDPAYVYNMFVASSPHKQNMQREEFGKIAINQVIVDDVAYWIVLFGY